MNKIDINSTFLSKRIFNNFASNYRFNPDLLAESEEIN
jgi:hypothetical protein